MHAQSRFGRCLAVAGAGLLLSAALGAQTPSRSATQSSLRTAAQAPAKGPWASAVPLPTGCYSSKDDFAAKSEAASKTIVADRERQEEINAKIEARFRDIDPMEMSQRMTQKMMEDPQNAAKYMEVMGATRDAGEMQAELMEELQKESQRSAEEKALIKRYEAAVHQAREPARARLAALHKRNDAWGEGEAGFFLLDWAQKEHNAIVGEADQAYEAICPQWWGATGHMHAFMKRYKDYLVKERIPYEERGDAQRTMQYEMVNTPAESYRSVVTHKAVEDYMKLAGRLFAGVRPEQPLCRPDGCANSF